MQGVGRTLYSKWLEKSSTLQTSCRIFLQVYKMGLGIQSHGIHKEIFTKDDEEEERGDSCLLRGDFSWGIWQSQGDVWVLIAAWYYEHT